MSSLFSLPLPSYQQPAVKSVARRATTTKKRKRTRLDDSDAGPEFLPQLCQPNSPQGLEYTAVLSPEERIQYRAAGHPFDQEPPPLPFPHAAAKSDRQKWTQRGTKTNPIPTLHLRHLAVITAILHRCLAEHDYARASRAFGLILRDSLGGHAVDVRNESRWGIGAEILLKAGSAYDHSVDDDASGIANSQEAPLFTREGFERAKRYYERLIIQHPFDKRHATSVNALDFYQALFGLWIYVVHEEGKTGSRVSPELSPQLLQRTELSEARDIAARMDACMSRVPFTDDLELVRLRGMVASWIADLAETCSSQQANMMSGHGVSTNVSPVDEIAINIGQTITQGMLASGSKNDLQMEAAQSRRIALQMSSRLKAGTTH